MQQMRIIAREIFLHALHEASIQRAFQKNVQFERGVLRIRDDLYDLGSFTQVLVLALGKAGHSMAQELRGQIGTFAGGIIATPNQEVSQVAGFRYYQGGHPLPNSESIHAADAVLKTLSRLPSNSLVIYLISGGGSAVLERPLGDNISLDDLVATYGTLIHCGAPIAQINALRKHLSAVKGGRLAQAAAQSGARQVSILISDVPDDSLDSLASGPTMPDSSTIEDCFEIARRYSLTEQFPETVRSLFARRALEETPKKDDPVFHDCRWWPILSNATAVKAAAMKASEYGFAVEIDNTCDDWDHVKAADYLLQRLRDLRSKVSRVCLISGGEVTVRVAGKAGIGGRNQQFALECASRIVSEKFCVLSAGTDGIDGNSPAAGAVVDGETILRSSHTGQGASVADAIRRFDAYPLLHSTGDSIVTGPTGNNVRDLRILLGW